MERLKRWINRWSRAIVKKVNFEDDDLMTDILAQMLKVKPLERYTAAECLERGCNTGLFAKASDGQVTNAAKSINETTRRPSPILQTSPLRTNILQTSPLRNNILRTNPILSIGDADAWGTRAWGNRQHISRNTNRLFENANAEATSAANNQFAMDTIEPWSIINKPRLRQKHLLGAFTTHNQAFWQYMR
ncbi:MAG: hypothetical protein Q9160_009169 [Pyrenula sp. 1 TL-2023]